jgi:hypothetical protein
MKQQ